MAHRPLRDTEQEVRLRERLQGRESLSPQQREQAPPPSLGREARRGDPKQIQDRRSQVQEPDLVIHPPGRPSREPHQERDMDDLVIERQSVVQASALEELLAVVRHDNDRDAGR